ncbi:DUF3318 domain-containing protein [Phormidium sp. CLA17]|uniref:DUF3318 domain-containing protein n=1 Tax=Leptolyngbya sp. Cla-17 TaxID=2803751 RepID=UPI0014911B95|nr:DUF3318 domain-containing protein [Leptolyngbya sp. Cla-17]MBM0740861.1 DUF3318 domain-containing protein [Leptolyngbya sp. Cla-17]
MYSDSEIRRLMDLLPASGRMMTKLMSKPEQRHVIDHPFPMPWMTARPVWVNFNLLSQLSRPECDLLVLRTVSWITSIKWFRPNWYQAAVLAGLMGITVEAVQADAVGMIAAGALSAIAGTQIWRENHSTQKELDADETALQVAQRRGYTETEAVQALLSAIEAVAQIEGRNLTLNDLLRSQNLRAIAQISPIGIPANLRKH